MLLGENSDYIEDLFGAAVQYQVPRYQRRYVWDTENWSALWEDIFAQLNLKAVETIDEGFDAKQRTQLENTSGTVPEDDSTAHFTGIIVTRPISKGKLARFEVIDGQQRLTTFQIIFCVIRDMCELKNHNELAGEIDGHIVNATTVIRRNISERFPDPTYKFCPTDYDKSAFQAIIQGEYGKVVAEAFDEVTKFLQPELIDQLRSTIFDNPKDISNNILDAYDYFYERIRNHVGENCDYGKVDNLVSSIKSGFNLIHITLGSSDRSEEIFESLNATGRKLSEFDYLRNNLFLRAGKLKVDKESDRFYSDIFYDQYWHFENDSHYWNVDRLESFFRTFLIAKLGPGCLEAKNAKPFEVYRRYSKTLTQGIEHEFQQLWDYAQSYKELDDAIPVLSNLDTRKFGNRMRFYGDLNLPRLDPFILFLKHERQLKDGDICVVCDILESYIIRRMLCCDDKDSCAVINDLFSEAIKKEKFSKQEFAGALQEALPDHSNKHFSLGNALSCAWSKDDNLILYILYRIELLRREEKDGLYKPLNFGDLKVQARMVSPLGDVSYPATESIGNMILLTGELDDDWDSFAIERKQQLLPKLAPGLELSIEITHEPAWVSVPKTQIMNRTTDLLSDFSKIWKPILADYI